MTGPVQDRHFARLDQTRMPSPQTGDEPNIDMGRIMRAMRRQTPLVAGCGFAGAVISILMILGSVPKFAAVETVLLDEERADLLDQVSALPNAVRSDSAVQSEIEILRSQDLAYQVVDLLSLDEDAGFLSPPVGATETVIGGIMSLTDPLARLLSPPEPAPGSASDGAAGGAAETQSAIDPSVPVPSTERTPRDRAAGLLRDRLTVSRSGRSFVINIRYEGYDPRRAALIARGYGTAYERFQLESTNQVAGNAAEWLQERIAVLEQQSLDAASAVQEFRAANDLIQVRGDLLTEQQLSELSSELVAAAADTAEARAELDSMESLLERAESGETVVTVPSYAASDQTLNNQLRRDYLDATLRYNRLVEQFGEDNEQVRQAAQRISGLRGIIRSEIQQAAESARIRYNVSLSRERSLRDNLEEATSPGDDRTDVRGRLRQLEAISDTYDAVYREYLQRFEVATQQQQFPIASVKVISRADVPRDASSPQKKKMLVAGAFLGGFVGIMIAAILELRAKPVRTAKTMRDEVGVACAGLLPPARPSGDRTGAWVRARSLDRAAEAVELAARGDAGFLVGIAALTSGDGYDDTFPDALAQILARDGRRRVLLVGSERPVSPAPGVEATTPDFLAERLEQSGETPEQMTRDLRASYAAVIVELPSLDSVRRAEPWDWTFDATLLRVPWGKVPPGFVADALRDHPRFSERLVTTVLEGANLRVARRYMSPGSYEDREAKA